MKQGCAVLALGFGLLAASVGRAQENDLPVAPPPTLVATPVPPPPPIGGDSATPAVVAIAGVAGSNSWSVHSGPCLCRRVANTARATAGPRAIATRRPTHISSATAATRAAITARCAAPARAVAVAGTSAPRPPRTCAWRYSAARRAAGRCGAATAGAAPRVDTTPGNPPPAGTPVSPVCGICSSRTARLPKKKVTDRPLESARLGKAGFTPRGPCCRARPLWLCRRGPSLHPGHPRERLANGRPTAG